ncbi:tocopherol cyclase family protein [Lewinella sp. 4G2]|uniref:tocopherol cyclase family protein n=1 Tax=Lewinella sp. 4G2 TaxID=1803372 RepID=UPI0007B4DA0F|nr:tocopherol cyclase family protein [Lewinella sp. 4G2]OAV44015.1 hypothetical protein A3850_005680 [Lewinella sp. 4G2]
MKNFLLRRRATFDPPRFQGWGRERSYFEGWYFKVVVPQEEIAYAFIPGISYDAAGEGHAFLQVLNGAAATSEYHRYPVSDFKPAAEEFALSLGPHRFSSDTLFIDLPGLQFDINLINPIPWEARPLAPGIMGWYGFVPRMQCYHGLVSFHHELSGTITVNNKKYSAAGGVGYTEKDWGSGFPDAWVWCQSNHLSGTNGPACLMASVASIPWLGTSFTGFLATFYLEGELHLFTTWAQSQVQCKLDGEAGTVSLTFIKPGKRLHITGTPAAGGELASPITAGGMTGKINESLRAELDVRLEVKGELVYAGTATWAGLEVSDNAAILTS